MSNRIRTDAIVFCMLVVLGVTTRLAPSLTGLQTWNITATGAAALLAGFYFADLRVAILVPLLTMAIADIRLGAYDWPVLVGNYAAITVAVLMGKLMRRRPAPIEIGATSLAASTWFFVLSNLAVWLCWYSRDWAGFAECYALAIPFFLRTLAGDLAFSAILFGAYFLAMNRGWIPATRQMTEVTVVG